MTAGRRGGSVAVTRGQVAVESTDHSQSTMILAGQKVDLAKGHAMVVSGKPIAALAKHKKLADPGDAAAVELALEALEAARASGDEKAIKEAEKVVKHTIDAAEKAAKEADKASEKAAKAADDAAKAADKAAEDAAKAAEKAAEEAAKAAAKAAEEARKAAEKAAKDLLKLT